MSSSLPVLRGAEARRRSFGAWWAALATACGAAAACSTARNLPGGEGQHPEGWLDSADPRFHGTFLRGAGYPLHECRGCHGDDYGGGNLSRSCASAGCHERGVEACDTCHGKTTEGRPTSGRHGAHGSWCGECHVVPGDARSGAHPDGEAAVAFADLSAANGAEPAYDSATRTCTGTYCHGSGAPEWTDSDQEIGCDGCHGAPPASHAPWEAAALIPFGCEACHPPAGDPRHLDGRVDVGPMACNTCHGSGPLGAPPPDLDGETGAGAPGVGAHARHLDETLPDRIGRAVACATCHDIPPSVWSPGHIDASPPADVHLPWGGAYDASGARCTVWCHWDRDPGPVWNDASGAERACGACHGFPPDETRKGTPHPSVAGEASLCLACHPFDPLTHVDGHVDFIE